MLHSFFFGKAQSRWLILVIDMLIVGWAYTIAFLIATRFGYLDLLSREYLSFLAGYCVVTMVVFIAMKIHTGLIRYSNTADILRIFAATLITNLLLTVVVHALLQKSKLVTQLHIKEAIMLNFLISSTLLIVFRLTVKSLYNFFYKLKKELAKPILIYGSSYSSMLVKQAFESHPEINYNVLGFVDDEVDKVGKYIEQKKVYHSTSLNLLVKKFKTLELILSSDGLNTSLKKKAIEQCVALGIKVLTVPPASHWLNGQLSLNQVADLKIEDLLQRRPIELNNSNIKSQLADKRVLITGAAGSIGSEIVRQVLSYDPESVILCDQAESPLHELQLELEDKGIAAKVKICIANIQNYTSMQAIFKKHLPNIVFHAAAYKHVPLMENNPCQAVLDNVLGTKNVADLSVEYHVDKFIMISTDKAVNPTNIMGASKRLAEMYIQSLTSSNSSAHDRHTFLNSLVFSNAEPANRGTRFITTRFGNVLGSNGSVIPRFKAQIESGGPVTVTHPEITRYFMTIKESVQLVLEAGAMGKGGEIFVFDMGEPVKIVDLAYNMIKLSGRVPEKDIQIEFTGLRPGEKLYEELLNDEELTIPTHHSKIKISQVVAYSKEHIQTQINELLSLNDAAEETAIVRKMKEIVPEYKSNNSRFEELDLVLEPCHI